MRTVSAFLFAISLLFSCDEQRVFENNVDFNDRYWVVGERPEFAFEISDTVDAYNLYVNVRNSLDYPYANIFVTYYLRDSSNVLLKKDLVRQTLFNEKTGEPMGESGLGDLYDHRIPLLSNYTFSEPGTYKVAFEHYMRRDTLDGVLAVGLRVEKASADGQ